jgi:predicted negative regulator of RcsB-dependent stress response
VKKLFVLVLLLVGGLAAWRKIQARQADLDLWTEATTSDSY